MNLTETPLDQIGASALGHYKVAEKAAGKAEEHYKSAGIYLKHAKLRVLKTRGLTWPRWLADNCPIGKSRADEVIAISDGRIDLTEHRAKDAERKREARKNDRDVPAGRPEKPNVFNEGPSKQQSFDPVKEAEDINAQARANLLRVLKNRINNATEEQLAQVKGIFNV